MKKSQHENNKEYILYKFVYCLRTTDEMMARARKAARISRRLASSCITRFLPSHQSGLWGKGGVYHGGKLALAIANPGSGRRPHRDDDYMKAFLQNSSGTSFCDPGLVKFKKTFPDGAPILDFLAVDVQYSESWAYPSRAAVTKWQAHRGIGPLYPRMVDVREHILGADTMDHFRDMVAWFWDQHNKDQDEFPSRAVSFDTEQIRITRYDHLRMRRAGPGPFKMSRRINDRSSSEKYLDGERDEYRNLSVKIFFGNGITWAAIFSLPVTQERNSLYFNNNKWDPEIADFFASLPTVMGLGVREDAILTEEILSLMIPGSKVRIPSCELAVLAVLAGYASATNMSAMSVNLLGGCMNKEVSQADGKWHLPYYSLSPSMRAYLVSDVRFGHISWNVVMACLLREMFADSETACRYSGMMHREFVEWFAASLVLPTIQELSVHDRVRDQARTREDLIRSLQYRDSRGHFGGCPQRIRDLFGLIHAATPTLAHGGPRFLHLHREHFLAQHMMIRRMGRWPELFPTDLDDSDRAHIMFGRQPVEDMDWSLPLYADDEDALPAGLGAHPRLAPKIARPIFTKKTKYQAFSQEAGRLGSGMRMLVFEWIRISPMERAPKFLNWLKTPATFRHFKGLVDYIWPMLTYVSDQPVAEMVSEEVAELIVGRRTAFLETEREKMARLMKAVMDHKATLDRATDPLWNRNGDLHHHPVVSVPKRLRLAPAALPIKGSLMSASI